ncbi:HigA family addiction module antitoxin [Pseudomonas sp. GM60]|uniref:HigA family addiction module antitoxin n=1 Tax=Pseudomonas sp. GM60 TaxID=1144334 RepID=UPI000270CC7F|nr:HigA family addiction module antitoxin [Pseudomonas sp. GM60]EJM80575.1 addiction module antidote protein, HigA family [Pseudomonas sp. GM60]
MNRIGMRPIHPGEVLSEEFLKPLGITSAALARSLGEPEAELIDVVKQQSDVSAGLAKKLSMLLNTTPEFWLNLQSTYDLRNSEIERG